jgi:hypothetical protein
VPFRDEPALALDPPRVGRRLRGLPAPAEPVQAVEEGPQLWFVTVTVAGQAVEPDEVRRGLERLSLERPFVACARYRADRAEVQYWDESEDAAGAIAQAMRMWGDHELSALLPAWQVVGLEVVDRITARRRWHSGDRQHIRVLGEILPMEH